MVFANNQKIIPLHFFSSPKNNGIISPNIHTPAESKRIIPNNVRSGPSRKGIITSQLILITFHNTIIPSHSTMKSLSRAITAVGCVILSTHSRLLLVVNRFNVFDGSENIFDGMLDINQSSSGCLESLQNVVESEDLFEQESLQLSALWRIEGFDVANYLRHLLFEVSAP